EDLSFGLRRKQCGRFPGLSQAAPGDDDLAPALSSKKAGCSMTEPGGGAGYESDRMFQGRLRGRGLRSGRMVLQGWSQLANLELFSYIFVQEQVSRSLKLNGSEFTCAAWSAPQLRRDGCTGKGN